TLKHFLLKKQVLDLYRLALISLSAIPDSSTRQETLGWVRSEFERNKNLTDVVAIEEKLKLGRRELKQVLPWAR
ncbi:hypothetical protein BT96DRAFT_803079, partial [Gymnopus androsaceus JB14]